MNLDKKPPPPRTNLPQLRQELRTLPAKKRIERLVACPDTMRVVRSMPTQDLYTTIREVGVEDCLEVLELASPAQIQGFLDIDGWRRDRLDSAAVGFWLRGMFAANTDRAVAQLRGLDLELLTLLFKIHTTVYDLAAEEQPVEDVGRHSITPDQRYLIAYGGVGADDAMEATLQEAIERLMARDMLFVLRLCEAVRWELPSQLEEDAYRWRNGRLADLGFLPAHEAAEIFAWLDPDRPLPEAKGPATPPDMGDESAPSLSLATSVLLPWDLLGNGGAVLGRALQAVGAAHAERVAHEMMLVANRAHAGDGGDLGDVDALRATAHQVADTVGIALSYLARGEATRLHQPLLSTSLSTLFRAGHSLGLRLQRELRARIHADRSGLFGNGLLRLDAPLRELCAGLLRPRPLLYCGLTDAKRVDYRPPSSLMDLAAAAAGLTEAAFRAAPLLRLGASDEVVGSPEPLPTHGAILGALLGRVLLGRGAVPEIRALSSDELAQVRARLASGLTQQDRDAVLAQLDDWVGPLAPLPGAPSRQEAVARARQYAVQVLQAVVDELASADSHPEGRLLGSLWC